MNKYHLTLLLIITVFGGFLRFARLDQVPPHLSNDEISIAYDAYSLLYTGADEHNRSFPVSFQSHGTYKAPLYQYLLVPVISLFGTTDFAAKFPSAFLGTLTVFILGLLAYRLTGKPGIALLSAGALAVTPWHIYTSHMVLETNVALFFFTAGLWLYLSGKSAFSLIFLSASMYAYHTQWGLVPLLLSFIWYKYRQVSPVKARWFLFAALLLVSPLVLDYLAKLGTSARANVEVIWNDPGVRSLPAILTTFISNYAGYTNPGYLFFSGLGLFPPPHPYQSGLFLWPLVIPFFVGLYHLKKYLRPSYFVFFLLLTLLCPVVPALTHGGSSLIRNLPSVIPYSIIISFGLAFLWTKTKLVFGLVLAASGVFLALFLPVFLVHFPVETAATFQGYRPIAFYLETHRQLFSRVLIDDRFGIDNQFFGVPHLYFAYYNRFSPALVQHRQYLPEATYYGNYGITRIKWELLAPRSGTWYVVSVGNRPSLERQVNLDFIASFPDAGGRPAFEIWAAKDPGRV